MNATMTTEYRHLSSSNLNIPNGLGPQNSAVSNGQPQMMAPMVGAPRFEGPRSPPAKQNTSHVPCKFFRQGACQAGKACPFSHDLASTADNICKYFAKGNCKFGHKCANIHVLPDGRRVQYGKGGPIGIGAPLNIGGRQNPDPYHGQSSLTSSFIRANVAPPTPFSPQYSPFQTQDENFPTQNGRHQSIDIGVGVPLIDTTTYTSHQSSAYGSPREEEMSRFGLGMSPATKGLSVLDAPLPASFDSNGVSWIARHGPIASSVPSKFGLESPPPSLGAARDGRTSEALKNLHSSAFGDDTRDRFNGIAASPPAPPAEEYFGKRMMHSHRLPKNKVMSASLPKAIDQDWEAAFTFEEDYLPETLKDLMTPQEKARRGSRVDIDDLGRFNHTGSGTGTPNNESTSKFGSPSNASPSRWGPLFQRHQQQKEEEERAAALRGSAFGHVGSPLRNSSLHADISSITSTASGTRPIARPTNSSGDSSPYLASPPRSSSMSIISQQLQRTRISGSEGPSIHPTAASRTPIGASAPRSGLERQVSSTISTISSTRFTTPIDEEQGVFNMDGVEDEEVKKGNEKKKDLSWSLNGSSSSRANNFGVIGRKSSTTTATTPATTTSNGTTSGMNGANSLAETMLGR
ncbi:spindle poison sensitivity protein-like protein Scp3 [Xylogone sp. PMI_703]|nr:spindle poison sensitivity protein-like protein Scp3 [Xylogone sp. PMI_703]